MIGPPSTSSRRWWDPRQTTSSPSATGPEAQRGGEGVQRRLCRALQGDADYLDTIEAYISCQILQQGAKVAGLDKDKLRDTVREDAIRDHQTVRSSSPAWRTS